MILKQIIRKGCYKFSWRYACQYFLPKNEVYMTPSSTQLKAAKSEHDPDRVSSFYRKKMEQNFQDFKHNFGAAFLDGSKYVLGRY